MIGERKLFPCFFGSALKLEGVEAFAEGLISRYAEEVEDSGGVINMKKNNCFIAELGEEFMFYSAFVSMPRNSRPTQNHRALAGNNQSPCVGQLPIDRFPKLAADDYIIPNHIGFIGYPCYCTTIVFPVKFCPRRIVSRVVYRNSKVSKN